MFATICVFAIIQGALSRTEIGTFVGGGVNIVTLDTGEKASLVRVGPLNGTYAINLGGGQKYRGCMMKHYLLHQYLEHFEGDPSTLIIFMDSDIMVGGCTDKEILENYNEVAKVSGMPIIAGAEFNLWPPSARRPFMDMYTHIGRQRHSAMANYGLTETYERYTDMSELDPTLDTPSDPSVYRYQYLNSGWFMGPVHALRHLLAYTTSHDFTDDQYAMISYLKEYPDRVAVDYGGLLIVNLFHMDIGRVFSFKNHRVHNKISGRTQCFYHGNGPSKGKMYMLAAKQVPSQCRLVRFYGLFHGLSVLIFLYVKHHNELPQRSLIVWCMDLSKQGVAMGCLHFFNLYLAMSFSSSLYSGECSWYISNLILVVFFSLFFLMLYIKLQSCAVAKWNFVLLRTGEYGEPPNWRPWLAQLMMWSTACCLTSLVTSLLVINPLKVHLDYVAVTHELALKPHPRLEFLLVMVFIPILVNIIFAWFVDSLVKQHDSDKELQKLANFSGPETCYEFKPIMETLPLRILQDVRQRTSQLSIGT